MSSDVVGSEPAAPPVGARVIRDDVEAVEPAADQPSALPALEPAAGIVPEPAEVAVVNGPPPALPEVADDLPPEAQNPVVTADVDQAKAAATDSVAAVGEALDPGDRADAGGPEPVDAEPADSAPIVADVIVGAPISVQPVEASVDVVEGEVDEQLGTDAEPTAVEQPLDVEVVEETEKGETAESSEVATQQGTEEGRGLGWLLSMSGLGAVTPEPDPVPVSPAAEVPVSPPAGADAPVSGAAPVRTDWFSPSMETGVVEPRTAPSPEAEPPHETTDQTPAKKDPTPAEEGPTPAEQSQTPAEEDPTPAEQDPIPAEQSQTPAEEDPTPTGAVTADEAATTLTTLPALEQPVQDAASVRTEKAVRAPSMQLPTVSVAPPPEPELEPERRLADPEHVLSAYPWKVDPVTLRETAGELEPLRAVRDRLTDKLEYAERDAVRARLLSLRAVVSRVLGEYGRAVADGREALRHAEATGELRLIAVVQARLAHVQQWRGDYAEADRLYEEANSVELPGRLRAEMHVHAGRSCYEQGRYLEACNHFELALELRRVEDPDLVARTEAALDAVMARVQETGWGPYPRTREEILQQSRPPQPAQDHDTGLFGYADSNGDVVIPEVYAEAQPFREGAAWVRRPQAAAWELIDESGTQLLDDSSAYLQALPFEDGLAWVSREPAGGWFAVDWHNRVIVPGGFEEVRPFRRGVAAVRRNGWGALDRHGRIVVQLKYRGFATVLTGGGAVDGFTEEGLAVVDAGGRFGVVDRTGRLLVPPVHAELLIHPAAYVVRDEQGRWGALDRQGEPLVDLAHPKPADVVRDIDRLSSDTRPVL
ncbi:WG repeat-containing protein [Actinoplanes sp. NPDC049548]|uniref:WG repeat-containing protein n=1 Tax=Actinoplanes sp. NPDC049548 TaxID=3155152 RepID=UPI003438A400